MMANSLLNHSWPSFSRRWKKRWSFKRGSESKPVTRSHTVSVSSGTNPEALIAEDDDVFGCMAEEKESVSSSPDQDPVHSSTEDLLSIDSALQGSEYYKDLGLVGTLETPGRLVETSPETPGAHQDLDGIHCTSKPICHYLDESCVCSCSAGSRRMFAGSDPEQPTEGKEEALAGLARLMSTWEMSVPPTEAQERLSLDPLEVAMEAEVEEDPKENNLFLLPSMLSPPELVTWTDGQRLEVGIEPLHLEPSLEAAEMDCKRNVGKRLRSRSVPSPLDVLPSQLTSPDLEVSLLSTTGISPPVLDLIEKDGVAPEQVLMVQQVLKELAEYHRKEEGGRNGKAEKGTKVKRRLSHLRSRVTGSWQKEKGKKKDWEKEFTEVTPRTRALHEHVFTRGEGCVSQYLLFLYVEKSC